MLSLELRKLNDDWLELLKPFIDSKYGMEVISQIDEHLIREAPDFHPTKKQLLRPFHSVAVNDIKVIIVGHYPYPQKRHASGLPFSNPKNQDMAVSIKNVFKAITADVGGKFPQTGCLEHLPPQGVFLINRKFTTGSNTSRFRDGHANIGWEHFSKAVITLLGEKLDKAAFLLWGKLAKESAEWINKRHIVLKACHPSKPAPSAALAPPFLTCHHFSQTNKFISDFGLGREISWLPTEGDSVRELRR
jgi:uracil-DNA glycosylase